MGGGGGMGSVQLQLSEADGNGRWVNASTGWRDHLSTRLWAYGKAVSLATQAATVKEFEELELVERVMPALVSSDRKHRGCRRRDVRSRTLARARAAMSPGASWHAPLSPRVAPGKNPLQ
jgi:hypothetical protein